MPPVYKLYLGRYTPTWHSLTVEDQRALEAMVLAAFEMAGGRVLADCTAEWSNDAWDWFGIEQFPDLGALEQYHAQLAALGWHRYVIELTVRGTDRLPDQPAGVVQTAKPQLGDGEP